jgi:hypothetical protein
METSQNFTDARATVFDFLTRLEAHLNTCIPPHSVISKEFVTVPGGGDSEPKFFKKYVVPGVFDFLTKMEKLNADTAKNSLLCEGCKTKELRHMCSGTPASKLLYPYKKSIVSTLKNARSNWWDKKASLSNSCPDLALHYPNASKIVVEGKLFRSGGIEPAKSALVSGIFEAFFYRGLPTLSCRDNQNFCAYDYACLLAYDASPHGSLQAAWRSMNDRVVSSLWNQLYVFVMVVRNG